MAVLKQLTRITELSEKVGNPGFAQLMKSLNKPGYWLRTSLNKDMSYQEARTKIIRNALEFASEQAEQAKNTKEKATVTLQELEEMKERGVISFKI